MTDAGWSPDPTGRFTRRWFDGTDWTDQVLGADGRPTTDALARSSGLAPPGGTAPTAVEPEPTGAALPAPPPPAPSAPPSWAAPSAPPVPGRSTGPGLLLAVLGWVGVSLSLFALDWAKGGATFGDLHDAYADASGLSGADALVQAYVGWAGYVLLVLLAAGLLAVGLSRPSAGGGGARMAVAVVAGVGAALHLAVVVRAFRASSGAEAGAWLAVVGYVVALAGLAFGPRPVDRAEAR